MNVLFAYGFCGLGGVETSVLNRCAALRRHGIATTVFFRQFYGDGAVAFAQLAHVHVGLGETELAALLQRNFDVIGVIDYPDFVGIAQRAAPSSVLLLETHAPIQHRLLDFYKLADDPAISAVIVPSQYNRDQVLRMSNASHRIRVIPNCVNADQFHARSSTSLEERFGTLTQTKVILWVGRLEDEKNPGGFIELAHELARVQENLHFICIGDAPQDTEYPARLQSRVATEMRGRFTFIATVPYSEMPFFYSLAGSTGGCLVSTSRFESVPMTFIEAMACRCPVVSTNVGGVAEIVQDGRTGLLFEFDDQPAAVSAVLQLISGNQEVRSRIVAAALRYVRERHSPDIVGEQLVALLQEVTKSPRFTDC